LDFLELEFDPDSVLAFAHEYGSFGLGLAELFSLWCEELLAMKVANDLIIGKARPTWMSKTANGFDLWAMSRNVHVPKLGRMVLFQHSFGAKAMPASEGKRASRHFVANLLENRLRGGMDVRVYPLKKQVRGLAGFDLEPFPNGLRPFLWRSLILGASPGVKQVKCKNCPRVFLTGPGNRRSDAEFCSAKCKIAFYRKPTQSQRRAKS
jgi:hypothetical protein